MAQDKQRAQKNPVCVGVDNEMVVPLNM